MATNMNFNDILNYVAPVIVFIFLGWILYKPFSPMFAGLWEWLGNIFGKVKGEGSTSNQVKTISYE